MNSNSFAVASPLVDVVECVLNKDAETVLETGSESRVFNLISIYQGRFSLLKEGVLRLKQFYDMQMLLMKSHLHDDDGDSIELFFSKLVQVMELSVKQIFALLELSKMDDDDNDGVHNDDVSGDNGFHRHTVDLGQDLSTGTRQDVTSQHQRHDEVTSTSILSPQFDLSYACNNDDDEIIHHNDADIVICSKDRNLLATNRYGTADDLSSLPTANSNDLLVGTSSLVSNNQYTTAETGYEFAHALSGDDTCEFCKTTFTTKRDLMRHMRTHTGEKPYHCDVCLKYFARKDFLTKHKRTHTGEKPHACTECDKTFSQRSNLNKHMATHTKSHKYCCKLCERGFHQMINLHRHEQLHCDSSKLFQCSWCNRMGYQGSNCLKTFVDKQEATNQSQ